MLKTLLVSQYSTRPAGVWTKKKRYISGMNAIERIIACCCGSSVGIVVMRCETNEVMVMMISSTPGMAKFKPGMGTVSGVRRLGSHRNLLLNGMSSSLGVAGPLVSCNSVGSNVTVAWA